jgi:arginyl-tRNA--protein-N-Asp/Glu arginylyltransferase
MRFIAPPSRCEYLPDEVARLACVEVERMSAAEYLQWLRAGWRRFGHVLFRPACPSCRKCQSLRVPVEAFEPHRTQRRIWKANAGVVTVTKGEPSPSPETQVLYEKFHLHQHEAKGWPVPEGDGAYGFTPNPFPTEEWRYLIGERLAGVGYVDVLPDALSAIYFFYDPDERRRSLGTFNVLSIIDEARRRRLPWVYLGYYVKGCRSVEYKGRFMPNEVLGPDGAWHAFMRG